MHKHIKKSSVHGPPLGVWFGFPLCLHHLVDFAPLLAVLGEGLAVVGSQLDSPLSTVIHHLNCSDKVSEPDVVQACIPLGGGQGQPVSNIFRMNSSQELEVTRSHSSVFSVNWERLAVPNVSPLVLAETSLTAIMVLSSSSSFSLARENRTVQCWEPGTRGGGTKW